MNPLQIFEKHPDADAYRVGGFYSPYALVSRDKRFSDAELAAEWHKSTADFMTADSMDQIFEDADTRAALDRARDWMFWVERFNLLPHFDA